MEFYYAEGTSQKGPVSLAELKRLGLSPQTLVWREGMSNWQPANSVPELREIFAASIGPADATVFTDGPAPLDASTVPLMPITPAVSPSEPVYDERGYAQPGPAAQPHASLSYAQPTPYASPSFATPGEPLAYGGYATTPQATNGMAVASMILGILSIPFSCFYGIGVPCAILAIIFGHIARGRARRGQGEGAGMAMAGLICGYIAVALLVIGIVGVVIAIAMSKGRW